MNIVKIVIKGTSGYAPFDEAYEDKVTITTASISYEYKPHPESQLKTNIYRKWNYKTNSPIFKSIFENIADMTPEFLYNDEILFAYDIGPTAITATFDDKHKETVTYYCPGEFFKDYFKLIKELIPKCEYIPAVLLTNDDYKDNK